MNDVEDTVDDAVEARGWRERLRLPGVRRYFYERRWKIALRSLVVAFFIAVIWPFVAVVIPAGKVGVVFQPLLGGTSITRPLREGLNFVLPWNGITLYDTRVQVRKTQFETVTADGLHIQLGVTYRFRVHTTTAGRLHKAVGPQYASVLLDPAINAVVRAETAQYSADQVYGDSREELQTRIYRGVVDPRNHNLIEGGSDPRSDDEIVIAATPTNEIRGNRVDGYMPLVEIIDIMITEVRLPQRVREAIEKKEEQQQLQQEYAFRIEREKLESVRKGIEAEGIRNFQQTVQAGISETYLRWRGIEATLRLATSPNSKTVIIGGGRTGMPLILNTDEGRSGGGGSGGGGGEAQQPRPAAGKAKPGKKAPAPRGATTPNDSLDLTRSDEQGSLDSADLPAPARTRN